MEQVRRFLYETHLGLRQVVFRDYQAILHSQRFACLLPLLQCQWPCAGQEKVIVWPQGMLLEVVFREKVDT